MQRRNDPLDKFDFSFGCRIIFIIVIGSLVAIIRAIIVYSIFHSNGCDLNQPKWITVPFCARGIVVQYIVGQESHDD